MAKSREITWVRSASLSGGCLAAKSKLPYLAFVREFDNKRRRPAGKSRMSAPHCKST